MKSTDFRDLLFVQLHDEFLKPEGYRRRGRHSALITQDKIQITVELESSTWNTQTQIEFGINLQAKHTSFGENLLMNIGLRRYADPPHQRWSTQVPGGESVAVAQARTAFASVAVPLLGRMENFEGLVDLCAEFGPVRYYESWSWCLLQLGRKEEALGVIAQAIKEAPHEGIKARAAKLLQRHGA